MVNKKEKKNKVKIGKKYQADIWYLNDELKKIRNIFMFWIADHFRIWFFSYLLKNKSTETILSKIKSFIGINGKCSLFQTDNGKEFKNEPLKIYFENNDIKFINSSPYHPQSNGCCEALHKEIIVF